MIRRKRELFYFSSALLLCFFPWTLSWIEECSQEFEPDDESSFQIQACSVDELDLRLKLINSADVLGELICSDNEKRELTLDKTVDEGLTDVKFEFHPSLVESSQCNVTLCYEDPYYYHYYINTFLPLQYNDCIPPVAADIEPPLDHSAAEDNLFSNFITADLSYSSDVISLPTIQHTVQHSKVQNSSVQYSRTSTPIAGSLIPTSAASVLSQSRITESSKPTTHSLITTTSNPNNLIPSAISSLSTQASTYITSPVNSTNSTSTTNTNYLMSPVIEEPVLQGGASENLILVVSIPLSVTCLVAMVSVIFCILRIAFQRSYKRKLADSHANSLSSFDCKDSKEYFGISSSPSICTIISPLSPIDENESISERAQQPWTYGPYSNSMDTYSDSYVFNDSSSINDAANSIVSNSDPDMQQIVHSSSDVSNIGDNVSYSAESISLGSLEALPGRFLPYEDRRQAIDHRSSAERWERDSYIYVVDNYETII